MAGRWTAACAGLVAVLLATAWRPAKPDSHQPAPIALEPHRFYAVEPGASPGVFELTLEGSSSYELIVGSLGDAARTYRVQLSSQCCDSREGGAGRTSGWPGRVPSTGRIAQRPEAAPSAISELPLSEASGARGMSRGPSSHPQPLSRGERGASARSANRPNEGVPGIHPVTRQSTERRFFLHVGTGSLEDERGYIAVAGQLVKEGRLVRVFLDRDASAGNLPPGLIDEIVRLLDEEVIPRSRALIGEHCDVDGDGKLAVLVTGWLGRLCGGKTTVNGFVRASDFCADVDAPQSNRADILYLNSSLQTGPQLKTLLAHEYTHTVCFSRRLALARPARHPAEDDWLSEAIAHVAENVHHSDWSNLDKRIESFLAAPQAAPLVIRDYYRAGLWRDPGCRGATYLFLRYCVDRFGEELLRRLIESPACGVAGLERATGVPFPELFRNWAVALATDQIESVPLHGRLGACELVGLSRAEWRPAQPSQALELHGTSFAAVRISRTPRQEPVRITIEADRGAALQVSIARLDDEVLPLPPRRQ